MEQTTYSIRLSDVYKSYQLVATTVSVLKDINIDIKQGEMVAIMGPSGSGKSTLMNIIGLLDRPTAGKVAIGGKFITLNLSDVTLAQLRSQKIGFVFQSFQLLPRLSALSNVLLPTLYRKEGRSDRLERAKELLNKLGLKDRADHKPVELSGGEKQRIAIARALMNDPDIILADEPTGNLDSKSGKEVMAILTDLQKQGKTVVIITHDQAIAAYCQRTIQIFDGRVEEATIKAGGHHA